MDAQRYQPADHLTELTDEELLSLIEAGTGGAYAELYARYVGPAQEIARDFLEPERARTETDEAFLTQLKALLAGSEMPDGFDVHLMAELRDRLPGDSAAASVSATGATPGDEVDSAEVLWQSASDHNLVAEAFSTLPDNWQRILWLHEVEGLSASTVAEHLGIPSDTVTQLVTRAHGDLQEAWLQVEPRSVGDNEECFDISEHCRSVLVPALLISPPLIERLSDTLAFVSTVEVPPTGNTSAVSAVPAVAVEDTAELAAAASASGRRKPKLFPANPAVLPVAGLGIAVCATLIGLTFVSPATEGTNYSPGSDAAETSTRQEQTPQDSKNESPSAPAGTTDAPGTPGSDNPDRSQKPDENSQESENATDPSHSPDQEDRGKDSPSQKADETPPGSPEEPSGPPDDPTLSDPPEEPTPSDPPEEPTEDPGTPTDPPDETEPPPDETEPPTEDPSTPPEEPTEPEPDPTSSDDPGTEDPGPSNSATPTETEDAPAV